MRCAGIVDAVGMSQHATPAEEFRDAAMRMVAAAEHFKAEGELPPWARTELDSWDASLVLAAHGR